MSVSHTNNRISNPSAKQRLFVEEYLRNGLDPVAAHTTVYGGSVDGSNRYKEAWKVLNSPKVRLLLEGPLADLRAAGQHALAKIAIDRNVVLNELAKMAMGNMADFIEISPSGALKLQMGKCTREQMAAISRIKVDTRMEGGKKVSRVEIALHDKRGPLMDIAKMQGWLEPSAEPDKPVGSAEDIELRAKVRNEFIKMLDRMAKPAPLIDEEAK